MRILEKKERKKLKKALHKEKGKKGSAFSTPDTLLISLIILTIINKL